MRNIAEIVFTCCSIIIIVNSLQSYCWGTCSGTVLLLIASFYYHYRNYYSNYSDNVRCPGLPCWHSSCNAVYSLLHGGLFNLPLTMRCFGVPTGFTKGGKSWFCFKLPSCIGLNIWHAWWSNNMYIYVNNSMTLFELTKQKKYKFYLDAQETYRFSCSCGMSCRATVIPLKNVTKMIDTLADRI